MQIPGDTFGLVVVVVAAATLVARPKDHASARLAASTLTGRRRDRWPSESSVAAATVASIGCPKAKPLHSQTATSLGFESTQLAALSPCSPRLAFERASLPEAARIWMQIAACGCLVHRLVRLRRDETSGHRVSPAGWQARKAALEP